MTLGEVARRATPASTLKAVNAWGARSDGRLDIVDDVALAVMHRCRASNASSFSSGSAREKAETSLLNEIVPTD
jgi:hypothetical protein